MEDEFEIIKKLVAVLGDQKNVSKKIKLEVPNGDDAAVLDVSTNTRLVATTDTLVENRHFMRTYFTPFDVGFKAIAVNYSDLAAMGALPRFFLISMGLSPTIKKGWEIELYEGINEATKRYGGQCIGGNMTSSDTTFITVFAIGEIPTNVTPMTRSSAKPDDVVVVSGPLGKAACGLTMLKQGHKLDLDDPIRSAQCRPVPRTDIAHLVAKAGVKTAIDISDGLVQDLSHICKASGPSGLGARLFGYKVPVAEAVQKRFPDNPLGFALSGGEDYELIFCCTKDIFSKLKSTSYGRDFFDIGVITKEPKLEVVDQRNNPINYDIGWLHRF